MSQDQLEIVVIPSMSSGAAVVAGEVVFIADHGSERANARHARRAYDLAAAIAVERDRQSISVECRAPAVVAPD
jgi:hypothetical protein